METDPNNDAGEDTNVRVVHGALWRELAEPTERWRRTPWYLRCFYVAMFFFAFIYLVSLVYDWNEYDEDSGRRFEREKMQKESEAEELNQTEKP